MEYPTREQSSNKFDPDYDESYTSMSQLKKMPLMMISSKTQKAPPVVFKEY
jgi:hypothetical protein